MILSYMGCNFNLKQVECPGCGHKNIIDEKSIGFECEKCSADMVFIEGEIREKEHEV
jgi:ribosomal protein S27E